MPAVGKFQCRKCDAKPFDALHLLGKHARDVHGMKPGARKGRRKKKIAPVGDHETALLTGLVAIVEAELQAEVLTQDAYDRTLEYLRVRYGSPSAEPEAPVEEEETP